MTQSKPAEVRCPRCHEFKMELRKPGDGGRFACCGLRWTVHLETIGVVDSA